jgi:hypothetical protein
MRRSKRAKEDLDGEVLRNTRRSGSRQPAGSDDDRVRADYAAIAVAGYIAYQGLEGGINTIIANVTATLSGA